MAYVKGFLVSEGLNQGRVQLEDLLRSIPPGDNDRDYHNFIRRHEGLAGRAPAEAVGIKTEGENPWITMIQNASATEKLRSQNYRDGRRYAAR
jgi:hypothetical protein